MTIPRFGSLLPLLITSLIVSFTAYLPTAAAAEPSSLGSGQTLTAGQRLLSPDGRFRAEMQRDGNFVVYGPSGATWSSLSGGTGDGATAMMQSDGNLVVYRAGGSAMFSSSTAPSRGNNLVMQNDGNLVIYSSGRLALWSSLGGRTLNSEDTLGTGSTLATSQSLRSRNGAYTAVMQDDGNFVLYGPAGATWASQTGGAGGGVVAVMQGDGNFVLYAPGSQAVFSSNTAPSRGNALVVQDDGNLVIYSGGTPLWAKGQKIGGGNLPDPFPCSASSNACLTYTGFDPTVSTWGQYSNSRGNCTNYVAYRLSKQGATRLSGTGDAVSWRQRTINQFGATKVNATPTVGSVAWWGSKAGPSGHVGIVERVEGDRIWTSESVWNVGSKRRILTAGTAAYPDAFLHIAPGT